MTQVFTLHENDAWIAPLRREFATLGTDHVEWFLDRGLLDLTKAPPAGVFYNRMSASSHTRGHTYAPEYAAAVIEWLERHGRTVVNGRRALQLEVSKVAQYQALAAFGIPTPDTIAVVGLEYVPEAAARLGYPLILKHNRAGKGLGVRLVLSAEGLRDTLSALERSNDDDSLPRDGIWLVQRYIATADTSIIRAEFVGGKFLYAVRVDTSEGFELCPADVCQVPTGAACPAVAPAAKFQVIPGFRHPLLGRMEAFLQANGIGVGAIEFATDADGNSYAYDVNTNTNYNPEAEAKAGVSGMQAIARHLTVLAGRTPYLASESYAYAA